MQFRQGDLLIVTIDEVPKTAKKQKNNVLALGELSGHRHELVDGEVLNDKGKKFMILAKASEMVHVDQNNKLADHDPLPLKKGAYEVVRQREWKPTKLRPMQVVD